MKLLKLLSLAIFSVAFSWSALAQQTVDWDAEHALLVGQGCKKDVDAFVTQNGDDLSIVFTKLGVNLPGGGVPLLAMRSSCLAYISATVAKGKYIGRLSQNISYGVTKTAHSFGSVFSQSSFFGFGMIPHGVNLPYGQKINNPLANLQRQDKFSVNTAPSWYKGWCANTRPTKGLFQANISVFGKRDNIKEDLIMFVDGLDLKFEVAVEIASCQ